MGVHRLVEHTGDQDDGAIEAIIDSMLPHGQAAQLFLQLRPPRAQPRMGLKPLQGDVDGAQIGLGNLPSVRGNAVIEDVV